MPKIRTIQNSFTSGELDERLKGRSDVKHYYLGADKLRNVFSIPQGGVRRRPGTRKIARLRRQLVAVSLAGATVTAPNGGTAANAKDGSTSTEVATTTNISTTTNYVIVHVDFGAATSVLFADVEGLRLDSGANSSTNQVQWQYSSDNAAWTTFGEVFDIVTLADRHKRRAQASGDPISRRYWRLVRVGTSDLGTAKFVIDEIRFWTEHATSLSEMRLVSFQFSTVQHYLLAFTDRNCAVYKDGVLQADIPTPYLSADLRTVSATTGDITSINWAQSLDTLLVVQPSYAPYKIFRDGAHDEWNAGTFAINTYPTKSFSAATTAAGTPAAVTGNTTFGATGQFVAGHVGSYVRGNGGYARITVVNSADSIDITVVKNFDDTTAIPAGEWTIEESVWSVTRGWPVSVVFFQGRLWFGGSRDLPSTLWGSQSANIINFSIGTAAVTDAIEVTADTSANTNDVAAIVNLHVGRHLQVFTSSGEFYVPASEDEALTPNNVTLRSTSGRGSKRGLRPFEVDGATIFMQREGKALREFLFTDTQQAYQANNLSLLASHLIDDPLDITHRRSSSTDEADYILMANTDGSLTVFNTLRDQEINAFTHCSTDGDFVGVGVDLSDMYVVVERVIGGVTERWIEVFDDDMLFDCGVVGGAAASVTAAHLASETAVGVILDDCIQADVAASGAGLVTFARASTTDYQVGLHFPIVDGDAGEVWIRDMPVEVALADGTMVGRKKRVTEATVRLRRTTGVWINGNEVAFRNFGASLLDEAVAEFTGDKRVKLLGRDKFGQVNITVNGPFKFEMLALQKTISV